MHSDTSTGGAARDQEDLEPSSANRQFRSEGAEENNGKSIVPPGRKEKPHLMYHIDEGLSVISMEFKNHLNFILACEHCLNERDDFVWEQGVTD